MAIPAHRIFFRAIFSCVAVLALLLAAHPPPYMARLHGLVCAFRTFPSYRERRCEKSIVAFPGRRAAIASQNDHRCE
jgi:hypothetical protein